MHTQIKRQRETDRYTTEREGGEGGREREGVERGERERERERVTETDR